MSGSRTAGNGLLSPRKVALQLIGFVIGVALLAWCIAIALRGEGWGRITSANPWLVVALAGCSLVSVLANGVIFWLVIRPVQPLRLRDMEWLNIVTAVLNYAPIRVGLIARVAYHVRIDGMSLLRIGAWLAAVAYTLALTLGACIVTTVIRPSFDLWWGLLLAGQLVLGGLLTSAIMGQAIVIRYGRGIDRMLSHPASLWGAIGLRLVDLGAFVGRMACAVAILELSLAPGDVLLLGFAALALSLNPLGRTGFREMAVAFVASRLAAPQVGEIQLESDMATLALVESAGEAIVFIPLGAVALVWYRARWRRARPIGRDHGSGPDDAA